MKLRSTLMVALKDHIARQGISQAQAAKLFGVTQPRISDLTRGRIDLSPSTPWSTCSPPPASTSKSTSPTRPSS